MMIKKMFLKYRTVIENCSWLYIIQMANYVVPLISIPYLMRVIGSEYYGIIAMAQAFVMYLQVITDYSFNFTAARTISMYDKNFKKVKILFNDITFFRIYVLFFLVGSVGIIGYFMPVAYEYKLIVLYSLLFVIGSIFIPIWLFQGIEEMKYITFLNLIARLIYLCLVLLFIKAPDDYTYVMLFYGAGNIVTGLISMIILYLKYNICLYKLPNLLKLKMLLTEGKAMFIANICGNVYVQGAILITGFLAGQSAAAYFSLGQKISSTIVNLVNPFFQAIYPYICKEYKVNRNDFYKLLRKIFQGVCFFNILIGLLTFVFADYIAWLLQGTKEIVLINLIKLYTIVTFGIVLNVLYQTFVLAMGKFAEIQKLYLKVSLMFLFISFPLVYLMGCYGMIIALMVIEYSVGYYYLKIILQDRNKLLL